MLICILPKKPTKMLTTRPTAQSIRIWSLSIARKLIANHGEYSSCHYFAGHNF